jgi:CO/xanthine dehydrogenase FAD-binding subunit
MIEYLTPTSTEEAIRFLETYHGEARIIAGGTDLMLDIRKQKINPHCLVDITRIPGLDQIVVTEDFIEVGAAVTFAAIKDCLFLNQHVHALTDAARSVGAIGIQTAATWVGNIVQAMPAADGAIVAVALEAEAHVVDSHGAEWQPVESLFAGPGISTIDPSRQFITHIRFQLPQSPWGTAWHRIGRRASMVLPILNCAIKLCLHPGGTQIDYVTIALGPVAPRPYRARRAEAFLRGQPPAAEVFAQAARIVQQESDPRTSIMRASRDYRLSIIPPLVSDALKIAAKRARKWRVEIGDWRLEIGGWRSPAT